MKMKSKNRYAAKEGWYDGKSGFDANPDKVFKMKSVQVKGGDYKPARVFDDDVQQWYYKGFYEGRYAKPDDKNPYTG